MTSLLRSAPKVAASNLATGAMGGRPGPDAGPATTKAVGPMTTTGAPPEVQVLVDAIQVQGRHRTDFGDIAALAADIKANGLIHPIALTVDNRLIAGERRLRAVRQLGWTAVPVRFLTNITTAAALLRAERAENACRKDMLPSELVSLGVALEELERPKALERKAEAGRSASPGRPAETPGTGTPSFSARATEAVADALGVSRRTYERARVVHRAATDQSLSEVERDRAQKALNEMDRTETVTPVYTRWKSGDEFASPDTGDTREPAPRNGKSNKQVNRKPLPESARFAGYELNKAVERVERIVADARFPRNAEQVATQLRHHLHRSINALSEALSKLPNAETETTG